MSVTFHVRLCVERRRGKKGGWMSVSDALIDSIDRWCQAIDRSIDRSTGAIK